MRGIARRPGLVPKVLFAAAGAHVGLVTWRES